MTRIGTLPATMDGVKPANSAGNLAIRAEAAFTAQLLAMRLDSPAFRLRRRIEPALGIAAYREHLGRSAPQRKGSELQA